VFERMGFERLGDARDFFVERSAREGWRCPVCGNPCRCSATLFGRALPAR
jgi:hypothetical protein